MIVGAIDEPTLLGVAAIISALGGLVTTIIASRKSKRETQEAAAEICRDRLKIAREEAEQLAEELHQMKMKKNEG